MVHVCSPHFWLGLWWISANAFIKFYRDSSDYKMIMMIIFMANLDNHLPSNRERMARQRLHLEPFHRSYFLPSWFIICCHDHMCCRVVDIIMITSVATVIHHLMPWSHLLPSYLSLILSWVWVWTMGQCIYLIINLFCHHDFS